MINGIEGFLNDRLMDMEPLEESGELELIRTTPGSYLGSCRYKLPEDLGDEVYPKLFEKFEKYGIGYFFYIGGNDSMDTVSKLSRYAEKTGSGIRFMGIPKTIDNDLVARTIRRDLEARQNMWHPQCGRSRSMRLYMIIKSPSRSWRSWDAMPDG